MGRDPLETFRDYLQSLPEELLENVTEDYVWLAGLTLDRSSHDFLRRREAAAKNARAAALRSSTISPRASSLPTRRDADKYRSLWSRLGNAH
jgi:hypothetical protein